MKNLFFKTSLKGFSLVETLVSIAVLALITGIISSVLITTNRGGITSINTLKAQHLLSQSFEAIRSVRDQNFLYLTNGSHGLELVDGAWSLTEVTDIIDDRFTRQITIGDVYRDGSGNIDSNGTQLDNRSKMITIQIDWESEVEGSLSVSGEEIITDWQAFERISSTSSEWGEGTLYQTDVTTSGDGALVLDSFTTSWQNSFNSAHYIFTNNADANDIVVNGNIGYMVGDRNGTVANFTVLNLTDLQNITILGTVFLSNNASADAFNIVQSGDYVYVGTNHNQEGELKTINVSNPSNPSITNQYDFSGNQTVASLSVHGDLLFVGLNKNSNQEFYIFNIQTPGSPSLINSLELNADVKGIEIVNGIAYLALSGGGNSLLILDVTDPYAIQQLSSLSITPENNGIALDFKDNKIIFASEKSSSQEFKIVDVSNPQTPSIISGVEIGENIRDVNVFDKYAFITTNKTNQQFQVINLENINNPTLEAILDLNGNGNGIFSNESAIFITSDDNTSALDVLTYPVESYFTTGSFTSNPFNSGSDTTIWLNFHWEGVIAPNTTIGFQFRFASTEGGLTSAQWTGPDGTGASYYTQSENLLIVPENVSGRRWMQYQITLTGDSQYTPEVYSVRIQYSP